MTSVILVAYACNPYEGSEPGAGWAWTRAAAAICSEVLLVTRANNRSDIERGLREAGLANVRTLYLDLPLALRFKRKNTGVHLYYFLWCAAVRKLLCSPEYQRYDLIHHVTLAIDWLPSAIPSGTEARTIWGPVGGATGSPLVSYRQLGIKGAVRELVRSVLTSVARWLLVSPRAARHDVVIHQNSDRPRAIVRSSGIQTVVRPNVAIDAQNAADTMGRECRSQHSFASPADLRALFVGRLIPMKGLPIALRAMADNPSWRLDVLGTGPDMQRCRILAAKLGVSDRVQFRGAVPRHVVLKEMAHADLLLFPSLHDSAPWTVAEAMAVGLPVLAFDRGGAPTLMAGGGGLLVRRYTPAAFSAALAKVGANPAKELRAEDLWTQERLVADLGALYNHGTLRADAS